MECPFGSYGIWMFYEGNDLSDAAQYDRSMNRAPGFLSKFGRVRLRKAF